jgi:hypothetical protein
MRPRTLAILAAVVAALAAFVLLYERDLPSTDERAARAKKVFRVEADEIAALEIVWNGATVRLERDPGAPDEGEAAADALAPAGGWRMTAPFAARADRGLADRLAATLADLERVRRIEGGARSELGLEPARGRVSWTSKDGRSGALEIGGAVPASSNVIAADGAGDPLVVAGALVTDLDRPPGDWRAKELVSATPAQVERVRLVPRTPIDGVPEVVLARRGTEMAVEKPFSDAADRDAAEALLGTLTGLRAERFLDEPADPELERSLAAGPGRIELSLAGRTAPVVVEVGEEISPGGARRLRVDGQAAEARAGLADPLGRAPEAWRSRAVSSFEAWGVERLRIDDEAGKLELVRSGGDWLRDGAKLGYAEPSDLVHALTSARAESVRTGPEAAATPAGRPVLTAGIAGGDGQEETVTLYAAEDGLVPARVTGRDVVLLLPEAAVERLRAALAAVRAAEPVPSAPIEPAPADGEAAGEPADPPEDAGG